MASVGPGPIVAAKMPAPPEIQYVRTGYLADGPGAIAAADFYFGRCGSATVGELLAAGTPALRYHPSGTASSARLADSPFGPEPRNVRSRFGDRWTLWPAPKAAPE